MSPIKRFEEIQAWQEARVLVKQIYQITSKGAFSRDIGLRDQIQRASISIMANIAEGFDCDSNVEFSRFLGYAMRSVAEVQSLQYAAHDLDYINEESFREYPEQAGKTKGLIGGFIHFLRDASTRRKPSA